MISMIQTTKRIEKKIGIMYALPQMIPCIHPHPAGNSHVSLYKCIWKCLFHANPLVNCVILTSLMYEALLIKTLHIFEYILWNPILSKDTLMAIIGQLIPKQWRLEQHTSTLLEWSRYNFIIMHPNFSRFVALSSASQDAQFIDFVNFYKMTPSQKIQGNMNFYHFGIGVMRRMSTL
jgi:hypothetical protein